MPWNDEEARDRVARTEAELSALGAETGLVPAAQAMEAVAQIVALYGEALTRMVDHALESTEVVDAFVGDELVSHLLLVHDQHPLDCATRVEMALQQVRERGVGAELTGLSGNTARIRCETAGCRSTLQNLRSAIEEPLGRLAPEIEHIEIDDAGENGSPTVIPVDALFTGGRVPEAG